MNTIKKIAIASVLCASTLICYAESSPSSPSSSSSSSATPAPSGSGDISGTYTCSGSDPYSTPPDFKEKIIFKKNGDNTYTVQMIHSDNVIPYNFGTGIVSKNNPNVLSYVYWDPKNTSTMGTEMLSIGSDGSLSGVYADHNKMKTGTETCTKAS